MSRLPASADLTRRCVSRKRPKLRVVGEARDHVQHISYAERGGVMNVIEVWTDAEWAALHLSERPEGNFSALPGIGYIVVRKAEDGEKEEIDDLHRQYWAAKGDG